MDAFIIANLLFQGAAATMLIVFAAASATLKLGQRHEIRSWIATGEVPSVLELLEGPHDIVTPAPEAKPEIPSQAVA
jgi:hypothetical protein